MTITSYHAKYFAYELTRQYSSDSLQKLAAFDTLQKELEPQIDESMRLTRQNLYQAQDEVDSKKENLISEIEARLKQNIETNELFLIKWIIV